MAPGDDAVARMLGKIDADLINIKSDIEHINSKLDASYITRVEFEATIGPMKNLFYGVIGLILTTVVAAVLAMVVKQ